ncbi:MAG TPA: transporter substrate-binding domain-containing protein [Chthoniobacteraceae bacterium]|jgi:PAS domain S-box-containing protein|nr:transporter substrate-binding domain-containing protein [Chthoniobacteraceae bacterium]
MKSSLHSLLAAATVCLFLCGKAACAGPALDLTPEEAAFLREHPVWRVTGASYPPYQWLDEKGQLHGIAADYCELLKSRLNVQLQIVPVESWTASLQGLREKKFDLALLAARTPDREEYLLFTAPLLDLPPAIITRSDDRRIHGLADLAGRRVVVARSYPLHEALARDHPEIVLLPRDDEQSAVSAVALGDADAFVGGLAGATHAIGRLGIGNLKVAGELPYEFQYGIAVRKDWPEAVSILDKAIAGITEDEQAAIRRRWMGAQAGGLTLRRVLVIGIPALIAAVLLTLVIVNRRLRRLVVQQRQTAEALRASEEQLEETIRKRTSQWQLAEQRLREVTNRLPGAVYQFLMKPDGAYAFSFCSEGFEEMTGVSPEEALRDIQTVWANIDPDDLAELDRRAKHSAATMTRYSQDLRFRHPDGRRWWIRAESEPERDPDGTIRWNGNMMDITERKQLEEELAVAKSAAEAANRAKSAFLANMSHEIRTPMNAILGFSHLLLRDGGFTGVPRRNLETIHRSGEHLLGLISDILEMSKIEAGRVLLREGSFDLHALMGDLERMFQLRAEEKRLRFAIERAGDLPRYVRGDEAKLRQVLINLVGNAVKYTERGSVTVRMMVEEWLGQGVEVRAEILDTGPGIAADEVPRLFQQFEQTSTGRRTGGGTGLGLAISRKFVHMMGGGIQVTSELGRGTTFRFTVLLGLSEPALVKPATDDRRVLRVIGEPETLKILIADDKLENCELLQQMLEGVGFETWVVYDGEAALRVFADWHPRVVLMDLRMPGLDGHETIRRIRQMQNGRAAAIIAISASVFVEDRQLVFDAGGDDFLGKPLRESLLFAKLKQFTGVEYEYSDEAPGAGTEPPAPAPTAADIAGALSVKTCNDLRTASLSADYYAIAAMLDELAAHAPAVAATLRSRLESFDYTGIIELLKPGVKPASAGSILNA